MSAAAPSRLRRALARFASSPQELEAEELQDTCTGAGAVPIAQLPERARVSVAGTLRTVTLRPRAGVPALVAELYDGSGTMDVVWLGRRQIPGIVPGRPIVAHGLVSCEEGRPTLYNPRYELRCTGPATDG